MSAPPRAARRPGSRAWFLIASAACFAILISLGNWQIRRLHWKRGVLAQIALSESSPPAPLPPDPSPFQKVFVEGDLRTDLSVRYGADVRDTPAGSVLGADIVAPLERPGQPDLLVDLGWAPQNVPPAAATPPGPARIEGFVRAGARPGWFSAPDDPSKRLFYTLDPSAIAAALRLPSVAPYVLVAMGPAPPAGAYPRPAESLPRPPNDHLNYALTWYGLAAALVVVCALRLRSFRRDR